MTIQVYYEGKWEHVSINTVSNLYDAAYLIPPVGESRLKVTGFLGNAIFIPQPGGSILNFRFELHDQLMRFKTLGMISRGGSLYPFNIDNATGPVIFMNRWGFNIKKVQGMDITFLYPDIYYYWGIDQVVSYYSNVDASSGLTQKLSNTQGPIGPTKTSDPFSKGFFDFTTASRNFLPFIEGTQDYYIGTNRLTVVKKPRPNYVLKWKNSYGGWSYYGLNCAHTIIGNVERTNNSETPLGHKYNNFAIDKRFNGTLSINSAQELKFVEDLFYAEEVILVDARATNNYIEVEVVVESKTFTQKAFKDRFADIPLDLRYKEEHL